MAGVAGVARHEVLEVIDGAVRLGSTHTVTTVTAVERRNNHQLQPQKKKAALEPDVTSASTEERFS